MVQSKKCKCIFFCHQVDIFFLHYWLIPLLKEYKHVVKTDVLMYLENNLACDVLW